MSIYIYILVFLFSNSVLFANKNLPKSQLVSSESDLDSESQNAGQEVLLKKEGLVKKKKSFSGIFIGKEGGNKTVDLSSETEEINYLKLDKEIDPSLRDFSNAIKFDLEKNLKKINSLINEPSGEMKEVSNLVKSLERTAENMRKLLIKTVGLNSPAYQTMYGFFISDIEQKLGDILLSMKGPRKPFKILKSKMKVLSGFIEIVKNMGGCLTSYESFDTYKKGHEYLNLEENCRPGLAFYFALKTSIALSVLHGPLIKGLFSAYETAYFAAYGETRDFEECANNKEGKQVCDLNNTGIYFYYKDKNGKRIYDWLRMSPDEKSPYFRLFGFWSWRKNDMVFIAPAEELKFVLDLVQKQIIAKKGDLKGVEIGVSDSSFFKGYPIFFSDNLKKNNLIKTSYVDIIVENKYKFENVPGIWFLDEDGKTVFLVKEEDYLDGMSEPTSYKNEMVDLDRSLNLVSNSTRVNRTVYFGTNQLLEYKDKVIVTNFSLLSPSSWKDAMYRVLIVNNFPSIDEYYSTYYFRYWINERGLEIFMKGLGIITPIILKSILGYTDHPPFVPSKSS